MKRSPRTNRVTIRPVWSIQDADGGPPLPERLLALLVQVQAQGSLLAACERLGMSYRHGWDLVRQGEAALDAPLLHMARGKGSTLTPLGAQLVWADHRITARLGPVLDSLACELAAGLSQALGADPPQLRLHASHGFAVEALVQALGRQGVTVERRYGSSVEAAAALHDGACDLAGLHLPEGPLQAAALAHYAPWLGRPDWQLIDIATRRQGLMLPAGNPAKLYELADLTRPGVRFINRQAGSGTRFLLEGLLAQAGVSPQSIPGFEQGEFTHAAVAAFVASGMADVGFGLETPARHFRLDFLPLASERYFLLCRASTLDTPALHAVLAVLRSAAFHAEVDALPGYHAGRAGHVQALAAAFPPSR